MYDIEVLWHGVKIIIHYRIYDEISKSKVQTTTGLEKLCTFTRHHNGYIREIAILALIQKFPTQSIPFVVQLLAEYVVEIAISIIKVITTKQRQEIQEFLKENPKHAQTISSKIASYWDCYYKWNYFKLKDYPAYKLLNNE
ncbi:hypothetical protein [Sphingobacterium sp. ML3W]|uniref:hypothetical protein n=1 Tax=Sphingobacterium sp. ML3W TaxID=1538644 RepID=UPI000689CB9F|nr:hypothetical protein [Sphingobacterium sp. ML3W]